MIGLDCYSPSGGRLAVETGGLVAWLAVYRGRLPARPDSSRLAWALLALWRGAGSGMIKLSPSRPFPNVMWRHHAPGRRPFQL